MSVRSSPSALQDRIVRYDELAPCTTAFIDARTPGSDAKENFTIIGPGVAENPDQHVHIREPHGFNIGGARQPPHCVNSQHFHETAEVFFVHSGRWAFRTGEHADEAEVILGPGDTISIPIHVFRGFENVGDDTGFLYAVLGGDDPGRVVWAPHVLEKARGHGLALLKDGRLVDTAKGGPPIEEDDIVGPEPRDRLDAVVRHVDVAGLEAVVVRGQAALPPAPLPGEGVSETVILGLGDLEPPAPLAWPHGFSCRRLILEPQGRTRMLRRDEPEVLFIHAGRLELEVEGERTTLGPGDTATIPTGAARRLESATGAHLFVTRGGDAPAPARIVEGERA